MPDLARPRSPHDALFKAILALQEEAAGLLARALPPEVAEPLDLSSVQIQPGSFVGADLRRRHTDVLLSVNLKDPVADAPHFALVYILFEHQSSVDRWMAWRLYEYCGHALAAWLKKNPGASQLPVIVPVVLYHGRRRWTAPTTLEGLVAHPPASRTLPALGPDLRYHLLDLSQTPDASLAGRAVVELMLLAMKYAWKGNLWRFVSTWLAKFRRARRESSADAVELILRYMMEVSRTMPDEDTQKLITSAVGEHPLEDAMSYSFPLLRAERKRARQEGRQEGRQEERLLTKRELVALLLTRRFGPVPEPRQPALAAADEPTLDRWFDRVLTAASLDEVLSD